MSVIPKYRGHKLHQDIKQVPEQSWDAIVIGSGIGGMACAASLAKCNEKVLVLERHYLPGGFTHSFARKGYQWDAGVHAIGEMGPKEIPGKILRWLSNDEIEMVPLGDPFDEFHFPGDVRYGLPQSSKQYRKQLLERFPKQTHQIDAYLRLVNKIANYTKAFFALKTLPEWVDRSVNQVMHTFQRNWWNTTTEEVLNELNITGKLRTLLTVHWGYYGSVPAESSFAIHALTHIHFWNGAYYPKRGSKVFAESLLGNVLDKGGRVGTSAEVTSLIVDNNQATGVILKDGRKIFAKRIISAAGAKTTLKRIVPNQYQTTEWGQSILATDDSPPYLCLNLGFKGDIKAAGAKASNQWLFNTWQNDMTHWDIKDPNSRPHILYLSFPSLKDPLHEAGPQQKHTGECVTFVTYDNFSNWQSSTQKERPADYTELKESITQRMLSELKSKLPNLMKHLDYYELSTPLTTIDYTLASKGAIYGLAATPQRFTNHALRARTPIRNFYMTGVDIASLGVVGGMVSGVLTAAAIKKKLYLKLL